MPSLILFIGGIISIWRTRVLTNFGPQVSKFEIELKNFLGINHKVLTTSNGTEALVIAIRTLGITNSEIVTTPYSFVATTDAILLTNNTPKFVDIEETSFLPNSKLLRESITKNTKAVLLTQVYGLPVNLKEIEQICINQDIPLIIDGAHSFGSKLKDGSSILSFGTISTLSFHATKVLSSFEGGAIISKDSKLIERAKRISNFGIENEQTITTIGTNSKMSEIHALFGRLNLKKVPTYIKERRMVASQYNQLLRKDFIKIAIPIDDKYFNYSYFPIIFIHSKDNKNLRDYIQFELQKSEVYTRKYFGVSLNKLDFLQEYQPCPVSEKVSESVLCLPIFPGLKPNRVKKICSIINNSIENYQF